MSDKSSWPTVSGPFGCNPWHTNLSDFTRLIEEHPMLYAGNMALKYLNLRVDTRNGQFLVFNEQKQHIEADVVVAAARATSVRKKDAGKGGAVSRVYMICDAYESGVGKGRDGVQVENPYAADPGVNADCHEAWGIGYAEGLSYRFEREGNTPDWAAAILGKAA